MSLIELVPTGVIGLDNMLGGGYPKNSIILVSGGPGTGKTIKSLQYTIAAINRGEPVVYVNLDEPWINKKKILSGIQMGL